MNLRSGTPGTPKRREGGDPIPYATPRRTIGRTKSRVVPAAAHSETYDRLNRVRRELPFATPSRETRSVYRLKMEENENAQLTPSCNRALSFGSAGPSRLVLSPEETNIQMLNKYRVDIPFASGKFSVVCRAYPKSPSSPPPSSSSDDPHHQHSSSTSKPPHSSSSETSDLEFLGSQSTSSPTVKTSRLPLLHTPIKSGLPKELVLKSTPIGAPKDHNEPGLREIRILDQLSRLAAEGKCYNFVLINDWYKTRESIYGGSAGSHAFVHGILEFANIGTLKHHQVCTLELWRNIAFQCLYALYIGQRELQLVHLDLHADNILLSTLPKGVSALGFRLPSGAQYFVATEMVKISDFSLSRIRVPDTTEVLSHKGRSGFEPTADLESLSKVLKQLKVHPPIPKDSLEAQHRRSFLTRLSHCMPGLEAEHIDQLLTMPLFDALKEMPSGENFLMAVA